MNPSGIQKVGLISQKILKSIQSPQILSEPKRGGDKKKKVFRMWREASLLAEKQLAKHTQSKLTWVLW